MARKGAPQAKCKCGHVWGSHCTLTDDGHYGGPCMSGWPFKPTTCGCTKFRPRKRTSTDD